VSMGLGEMIACEDYGEWRDHRMTRSTSPEHEHDEYWRIVAGLCYRFSRITKWDEFMTTRLHLK
jgi:hypothetical protein